MKKNFSVWHVVKTNLQNNTKKKPSYFYDGQIWYVACGLNLGAEQDGKGIKFTRPVLIVKKFNQETFWGVPLTSSKKNNPIFYYYLKAALKKPSWANLSQLKLFDRRRLMKYAGEINEDELNLAKQKIRNLLM